MYQCEQCGRKEIVNSRINSKISLKNTKYKECTIETEAGILRVSIADDGLVMMQQNKPEYFAWVDREGLLPCLGNEISTEAKSRIISTGLKDIIVPFSSVEALHVAKPFRQDHRTEQGKRCGGNPCFCNSSR